MNWSPESIVPMMNPNEFLVDLMLAQFDPDKEEWEDIEMLVTGVENTGSRLVDIPLVFTNIGLLSDIRPIAVQVRNVLILDVNARLDVQYKGGHRFFTTVLAILCEPTVKSGVIVNQITLGR